MLPAPRTTATSTPCSRMRAIWPAMAFSVCGSVPKSRSPMSASPDSLSRTRLKAAISGSARGPGVGRPPGSRVGPLLRADREAREALDDDVLAGLGRQLRAQLLDRLA